MLRMCLPVTESTVEDSEATSSNFFLVSSTLEFASTN